jgi:uridine kinase
MKRISITFPNDKKESKPFGIPAIELVDRFGPQKDPLAAVLVNNELCSVFTRLEINCQLEPVSIASPAGAAVYRRSLCFILAIAAREIFPKRTLVVGHSLGDGYYHTFEDEIPVTLDDIEKLEARMRGIVAEDQAIKHSVISYADALDVFERSRQTETLLLLNQLNASKIPINTCRGFMDLAVAPLVPSSGVLKTFDLMPYAQGFILRFPAIGSPHELKPFTDDPHLYAVYKEYKNWGKTIGVSSVGSLNKINQPKAIKAYIQTAEALQNKKIAEIADKVAAKADKVKVVLIAGPSSSGKTTFAKKLSIQLTVLGITPIAISLDDYFVDRERTPRDEKGEYDYECLQALDVDYLNDQLIQIFAGRKVELPEYDFKLGKRKDSGRYAELKGNEVLILEGIHGLNDELTHRIPREQKFKIYVSALTQLNLDDHNRIPTTDNRVIRRMVRDFQFRGHSAQATLKMWPSVQRGEHSYIFPYQNSSDAVFNSALDYELSILRVYADPLLKQVKPMEREYAEASRLLSFLDYFTPIPAHYVPKDSILREFIGESDFKY